jgi:MFS transporter, DHA1 family, inner membrane transport protein
MQSPKPLRSKSPPLPVLALALSAFAIGTTEFVIVGVLPEVAADLKVTISKAGLLVTGYALGVAVGAPLMAMLTSRWPRKPALLALMGLFIVGNLICATAGGYTNLMIGRIVASFAHGSFFGIGAVVAAGLVDVNRRAGAIALMFTGLTLANVLGVPLGTLIGQQYGWRSTFGAVSVLGIIAALSLAFLVPRMSPPARTSASEWAVLKNPQVLLALSLTVFGFGGVFTAFTYIAPMLRTLTGLSASAVSATLFLFGLGLTVGNAIGGKLADWRPVGAMFGILTLMALVEAILSLSIVRPIPAIATVFVWGVAAFAAVPGLQMRVVAQAREAPTLASTLNIAAFNIGNAGGAWLGSALIDLAVPLRFIPLAAAAVAVVALAIALLSWRMERAGFAARISAHEDSMPHRGTAA